MYTFNQYWDKKGEYNEVENRLKLDLKKNRCYYTARSDSVVSIYRLEPNPRN